MPNFFSRSTSDHNICCFFHFCQHCCLEDLFRCLADAVAFFFLLRLPYGQCGPVSQLSRSEESCTGPFNWGEAHCAGEKVKRKVGPFKWKSLCIKPNSKTTTTGRGPPRQPGTPRPGSQVHGPKGKRPQQTRDFTNKSWYALTY